MSTSELHGKLTSRPLNLVYDYLTPQPSHLLDVSLQSLGMGPRSWMQSASTMLPTVSSQAFLKPAHHLIYFPPQISASSLLSDGTDPVQSPGEPYVRRMWAGGRIRFLKQLPLACQRAVCVEGIRDVTVKGITGEEKVFVGIERRVAELLDEHESEESIKRRVWTKEEAVVGDAAVIERRNLVFMRELSDDSNRASPPQIGDRKPIKGACMNWVIYITSQRLFGV